MEKYFDMKQIPENIKNIKIDIGLSFNLPHSCIWLANNTTNDLFVIGFEPNPSAYNHSIFKKNSSNYKDRFAFLPVALNNVKEQTVMKLYDMENDCGTSSLYYPLDGFNLGKIKNIIEVPVFSLKDFFDIFDWNRFPYIEYLKIDAQGSDYNILLSAGDYLKDRVVYITAEPEFMAYENCQNNNAYEMAKYLASQGFIGVSHPNTKDPTFLNMKFYDLKDDIFIYQKG